MRLKTVLVLAALLTCVAILAGPGAALAASFDFSAGQYDNTANTVTPGPTYNYNQTTGNFRDVFWWNNDIPNALDFINSGNNLVLSGNHARPLGDDTALNFTGIRTSGGASFLSIYDQTPGDGTATKNLFSAVGGLTLSADVLFAETSHSMAGGVVALYNEGQDGLALLAKSAGNTDDARLDLVFSHAGSPTLLTSVSAGANFQSDTNSSVNTGSTSGDHWYRLVMTLTVTGDAWTVHGDFYNHTDPTDPNSALGTLVIASGLDFNGSLSAPGNALDLTNPGEVGLMAWTSESFSDGLGNGGTAADPLADNIGVSITNFTIPDGQVPEPVTMLGLMLSIGGVAGYIRKRRMA